MDDRIAKAFTGSALTTFKDMFALDAQSGQARVLTPDESHGWDVTGLIGLAGQAQGVMAVRLTHELLGRLLTGTGVVASTDQERKELEGGLVGELTNIIAGHATSALRGLNIEIAPPVVIRGANHHIGWPSIAPVQCFSFSIPGGAFEIDLCINL